jgi:hypothetical protein
MMINQATRRTAQIAVQNILRPTYFDYIPIGELDEVLQDMGIVMVQEDNTEWAGLLMGDEGEIFIRLAPMTSADDAKNNAIPVYTPYENTGLRLTWYRCESRKSRKMEVIGYVS